jgi:hypothetical protein
MRAGLLVADIKEVDFAASVFVYVLDGLHLRHDFSGLSGRE